MAGDYIITGGRPLNGTVWVPAAKNSVLPLLAASLLCSGPVRLCGVPELADVAESLALLRSAGCTAERQGADVRVDGVPGSGTLAAGPAGRMRASILFCAPLLARLGRAQTVLPGGCRIGARPIDLHLAALERMGAVIREDHGALDCTVPMGRLHGAEIVLSFPSVGATQNVLIAAVLAEGRTILRGAAQEPEIDDLIRFLNGAGARIRQDFAGTLIVDGVDSLHAVRHRVIPDRIAAATYLCCAAAAGGSITVEGCVPAHLAAVLPPLEQAGCRVRTWRDAVAITVPERLGSLGWVRTMPYSGFPTDAQAPLMAAALKADGTTVFTETIFQNRYRHVSEMARMGARVRTEGKGAIVTGVPRLHGASVRCTDLRGGAALCAAALAAEGQSVIAEIHHIERGYEHLDESLRQLGANITRSDHETEAEETQTEQPATSEEGAGA